MIPVTNYTFTKVYILKGSILILDTLISRFSVFKDYYKVIQYLVDSYFSFNIFFLIPVS